MYFVPDTVDRGCVLDYRGTYFDRVYAQYRTKPKAVQWYEITKNMAGLLVDTAWSIRTSYDIDNVGGERLDVIGRIVVASRNFTALPELFPGIFDLTDGSEFGDEDAMFSELTVASDAVMSDDLYRLVIKSKIAKNNGDATIESILDAVSFLLPKATDLRLVDSDEGDFHIEHKGQMTNLEKWALTNNDLVPKPLGITFTGFVEV